MAKTNIEWADAVWNPITGCMKVSAGCRNCYAERMSARLKGMGQPQYENVIGADRRWTGDITLVPDKLADPLKRKKATEYFVNSMSDLFHGGVPNEYIAAVFGVMAACPQHTFKMLTKRPERMVEWFDWVHEETASVEDGALDSYMVGGLSKTEAEKEVEKEAIAGLFEATLCGEKLDGLTEVFTSPIYDVPWPLKNVWIGTSVEDQASADERLPWLCKTPAAVRFVSCEPMLDAVDFASLILGRGKIHQIIFGGESGPGARDCYVEWIRDGIHQCNQMDIAAYVKQLGVKPVGFEPWPDHPDNEGWGCEFSKPPGYKWASKGGDMEQWPEDLRVREEPKSR